MKLIIGLCNPEQKYTHTRHNTGSMAVDRVVNTSWQEKPKFHAMIAEDGSENEKVLFFKTTDNYNTTGIGARALKDFYKLENSDILVVHDELALPLGTVRTRLGGSDAGNNGIKDLNAHLGEDYSRIRVGIAQEGRRGSDIDFVLSPFSSEQTKQLDQVFVITDRLIADFIKGTFEATSHKIKEKKEDSQENI